MKKTLIMLVLLCTAGIVTNAQKWEDLTKEQKLNKLETFRKENQAFLKDSLGMTPDQLADIDNVNICFLSTLERVQRYGKDEGNMKKFAQAVADGRSIQLEAIMGSEKRKKFAEYIEAKLKKAGVAE